VARNSSAFWHDLMNFLGTKQIPRSVDQAVDIAEALQQSWSLRSRKNTYDNLARAASSSQSIGNCVANLTQDQGSAPIIHAFVDRLNDPTEFLRTQPEFKVLMAEMNRAVNHRLRHPAATVAETNTTAASSSDISAPLVKKTKSRRRVATA